MPRGIPNNGVRDFKVLVKPKLYKDYAKQAGYVKKGTDWYKAHRNTEMKQEDKKGFIIKVSLE